MPGRADAAVPPFAGPAPSTAQIPLLSLISSAEAPEWSVPFGATVGAMAATSYVAFVNPSAAGHYPICPLRAITGLYCPMCGSTRAAHELLHGHLAVAFGFNQLFVLSIPFMAYAWLAWVTQFTGGPTLRQFRLSNRSVWTILSLIIAYGVVRNLPYSPLIALAP